MNKTELAQKMAKKTGVSQANGFNGNRLYRNDGRGNFEDVTDAAGVRVGGWGWALQRGLDPKDKRHRHHQVEALLGLGQDDPSVDPGLGAQPLVLLGDGVQA